MSILAWIVLGLIAGFIASKIYVGTGQGILMDIVLGIVGAVVGGYLFDMIGAERHHRIQHLEHAGRDRRRRVGAVDLSRRQRPQRVTSRFKVRRGGAPFGAPPLLLLLRWSRRRGLFLLR